MQDPAPLPTLTHGVLQALARRQVRPQNHRLAGPVGPQVQHLNRIAEAEMVDLVALQAVQGRVALGREEVEDSRGVSPVPRVARG